MLYSYGLWSLSQQEQLARAGAKAESTERRHQHRHTPKQIPIRIS